MTGQRLEQLQIFILYCVYCFHKLENHLYVIQRFFLFNNPAGMCEHCERLWKIETIDIKRLLDKNKSLNEGLSVFQPLNPEVGG